MAIGDLGAVLSDMEVLFRQGTTAGLTDVQLLDRFLADGEAGAEAAFTALVKRHGPMVVRVCRGELNDLHAAEDAFQATFLILARQARSIRDASCLASWLYGVARRVARRARLDRARRAARERRSAMMIDDPGRLAPEPPELLPEIQEELDRLPERYRAPILLCYLEGRTHEEAACQLKIPVGTVKIRLSRGRERLRGRLIRRGLAPALVVSAFTVPARAAIPLNLLNITVEAAMCDAASRAAGVSATVTALVQGVLRAMLIHRLKTLAALAAASMTLILASFVMVSVFASPVRSEQEPKRRNVPPLKTKRRVSPSPKTGPVEEVAVVAVKKSTFQRSTNQPGTVEPCEWVAVLPTASGFLGRLTVDIGSAVKRGDLLAEIKAPELELDLARSEAAVRLARARITTAKAGVQVAESDVKTARADVESSRTELDSAVAQRTHREKQYHRIKELVERGSVSRRLEDEELDRFEAARAAEAAAKVHLAVVEAHLVNAEAKVQAALAALGETEEGLRLVDVDRQKAKLMLESCRVRSPLDGFVTRRTGSAGEFVRSAASGGSSPIVTIVQTSMVRVVTSVPDRDVPLVDIGDPAVFQADAFSGREFRGKVSRIAGAEEGNDRTMRVEIDLDNKDGRLLPGMCGRVKIDLQSPVEALSIPSGALVMLADQSWCCFRVKDGHAVRTAISVVRNDGEHALVTAGLAEGDLVVADASTIRNDQAIHPAAGRGAPARPPTAPAKQ